MTDVKVYKDDGKITAPRIKELRTRKEELSKERILVEAEQIVEGVRKVDISIVKSYAKELHKLLEDAEISERKAFLKSFIKEIIVDGGKATIRYKIPLPDKNEDELALSVLLIDIYGGNRGTKGRTF